MSRADVEDLVAAYRADLVAAGMFAGHPVTSVARALQLDDAEHQHLLGRCQIFCVSSGYLFERRHCCDDDHE